MLMGEEQWGAATLCPSPTKTSERKGGTSISCYVHSKHNNFFVQIQEQLDHWWQEKYMKGKNTQDTYEHKTNI